MADLENNVIRFCQGFRIQAACLFYRVNSKHRTISIGLLTFKKYRKNRSYTRLLNKERNPM